MTARATVVGTDVSITGGSTLSVAGARAGDVAVLVVGNQFGSVGDATPDGWQGAYTADVYGRSGTIATLAVTDPADTQAVPVPAPAGGRVAAALIVLRGLLSAPAPVPWASANITAAVPSLPESGSALVLTAQHAVATAPTTTVTPAGRTVVTADGQRPEGQSWSAVTAQLVDDCHGETLAASSDSDGRALKNWAVLPIEVDPDYVEEAPHVGLEIAGQHVSIVGYQTTTGLMPARLMPHGATTVTGLLGLRDPWLVAHRGGSASWPEHTQRAYTEAVWAGAHALEFSAARTSDGVWLGCHDATLERLGGPSTRVSEMTWAQVEEAMSSTEYMPARLDWLLERYGDSHVIVFDPKTSAQTYMDEYLSILEPYKDSVILKFSGDSDYFFGRWKALGWTTWGYGYQAWKTDSASAWTSLTADASKDIISLDGPYTTDAWAEALAVGRPLVAHILTSSTAVDSAVSAGAVGAMVSGMGVYTPDF